jgi:lipopolysaccharide transport system permease protein
LLWLPLVVLSFIGLVIGFGWGLSLATVAVRDIQQVLSFIIMFIVIASPIAYTAEMVPDSLRILIYLNPVAIYVIATQEIIVRGRAPSPELLLACIGVAALTIDVNYRLFKAAKQMVADRI